VPHHVFGIRHHGPGSARSLRRALEALQPDAILVEGPPDADALLPLLGRPTMVPPVAILIYPPDEPGRAVYYPFAVFSPEWQAIAYGLEQGVPVRFIDLPQSHQMALASRESDPPDGLPGEAAPESAVPESAAPEDGAPEDGDPEETAPGDGDPEETAIARLHDDPLGRLAEAAGYSDGERWWEHMVEQRRDDADLFAAVLDAMTALREGEPAPRDGLEPLREAHMRRAIRAAEAEGHERIAVVCGAWHAPVLAEMPPARDDAAILKGLPSVRVEATWIPWTYGRLTFASGYGAGVQSPGWYDHLWRAPESVTIGWLTSVAQLLRGEGIDASSAHVIEAVRLAETLAALRARPLPGLPELDEASLAVLCGGNDLPMRLIHERLVVGERLGSVPDETPLVPLQVDLERAQRRLRLPPEASQRVRDLDLREPTDLARSHLLHRLRLLDVDWGVRERVGGGQGTFHEHWRLQWRPELSLALIQAGVWGSTIEAAAAARARDLADRAPDLPVLTALVERAMLASLPAAVEHLMARLEASAALASDVGHLMDALPPLASVLRYGSVRQTDAGMVRHVVDGLVARIVIGLPGACASLDDEAAAATFERLNATDRAIATLGDDAHRAAWHGLLARLVDQRGLHGLIAGRGCRLLVDAGALASDEVARRLGLALSPADEPARAAAWVEGFLRGSGLVLLHDDQLWGVLDGWVAGLDGQAFTALLPLLRRTFTTFAAPERRQIGERAARGPARAGAVAEVDFDHERAAAVLPLLERILALEVRS
jgi:hypothetical protein